MNQIPADFSESTHVMNPITEDLIRSSKLENGMFVLVESLGPGEDHECDRYKCPRLLRDQRWCRITDLVRHRNNELISFIGQYSDGTKATRTYNKSYNWYVKLTDGVGNFIREEKELNA